VTSEDASGSHTVMTATTDNIHHEVLKIVSVPHKKVSVFKGLFTNYSIQ